MNIYRSILVLIILNASLFSQSYLHFGLGVGTYGGATATPYSSPFLITNGFTSAVYFEKFIQENRSVSVFLNYTKYDKSELFLEKADSKSLYVGASYNFIKPLKHENIFYEISPLGAYGKEEVSWYDEIHSISLGMDDSDVNYIDGNDQLEYITLGARISLGYKYEKSIIKISLIPKYDIVIGSHRDIALDTQTGEKVYELKNPDFKSKLYIQAKISMGFQL